jgi:hypothetical protein
MRLLCVLLLLLLQLHTTDTTYLNILDTEPIYKSYITMNKNNPFNIRVSDNDWLGKIHTTNAFEAFDTYEHGIRAGLKLLTNYYIKYDCNTIHDIISRFAPESENDTKHYIDYVSTHSGISPNTEIDLTDKNILLDIARHMIRIESGKDISITELNRIYNKFF